MCRIFGFCASDKELPFQVSMKNVFANRLLVNVFLFCSSVLSIQAGRSFYLGCTKVQVEL